MRQEELYGRISEILQDTFGIEPERIRMDARLADDLDIDSIDAVDLIVQLKPLLGGNLRPEAFKTVRTIADVVEALQKMMQVPAEEARSAA
jgi:acyl carrier protein